MNDQNEMHVWTTDTIMYAYEIKCMTNGGAVIRLGTDNEEKRDKEYDRLTLLLGNDTRYRTGSCTLNLRDVVIAKKINNHIDDIKSIFTTKV